MKKTVAGFIAGLLFSAQAWAGDLGSPANFGQTATSCEMEKPVEVITRGTKLELRHNCRLTEADGTPVADRQGLIVITASAEWTDANADGTVAGSELGDIEIAVSGLAIDLGIVTFTAPDGTTLGAKNTFAAWVNGANSVGAQFQGAMNLTAAP